MLEQELKNLLEQEESATVSDAFGGHKTDGGTKSYSVPKIRDVILAKQFEVGRQPQSPTG